LRRPHIWPSTSCRACRCASGCFPYPERLRYFLQHDAALQRVVLRIFLRVLSRYLWATLLARIYEIFPLTCPCCHAEMRIIAFINEASAVRKILDHLGYGKWLYDRFSTGTGRSNGLVFLVMCRAGFGRGLPVGTVTCASKLCRLLC
jgi:hypothetical protein